MSDIEQAVVRDTGQPINEAGERVYEVVEGGKQLRTITMRDYDAVNYAKAMGYVYIQPQPKADED